MIQKHVAYVAKIKGFSREVKIKDIKKFFKPIRIKDFMVLKNGMGLVFFWKEQDLYKALKKKGKVGGRAVKIEEHIRKENETSCVQNVDVPKWLVKTNEETVSAILETGRLFVRNLSYACTEQHLEKLFSVHGSLSDIHLAFEPWSQVSKGFAFITFLFPSDAVKAYKSLDKTKFMNRLIHILPGQENIEPKDSFRKPLNNVYRNENSGDPSKILLSSFQNDRFQELKKDSGVGHNWNALFIRPDAVATYLAAKFGLTMEQVLDPSGNKSVAVRLAHGETQLVAEMKGFFKTHGVRLEAFEKHNDETEIKEKDDNSVVVHETSGQRNRLESKSRSTIRQLSGTAFLIKNLPAGTTEFEVRDLLKRYTKSSVTVDVNTPSIRSGLKRVLVPPLGITAIVEYAHSQQARLIIFDKGLDLNIEFRDSVLFLQWLPDGALKSSTPDDNEYEEIKSEDASIHKPKKVKHEKSSVNEVEKIEQSDDEFELITSIPTGKHKFRDDDDDEAVAVTDHSSHHDNKNNSCQISKSQRVKKYLNKKQKIVQIASSKSSELEIADKIMGHKSKKDKFTNDVKVECTNQLHSNNGNVINQCDTTTTNINKQHKDEIDIKKPISSKQLKKNKILIVRNIPFQATQKELIELFQPIGGLVNVRLPKKPTSGHRGFAFVEFDTLDKAKIALETLGVSTHLLGRRLLMEYAQT
uniref:Putative rna binding motif protein n=1 Tax=Schistosoma mansoni TaxID=6183 RepID=A0A5K4EQ51_SCHMA